MCRNPRTPRMVLRHLFPRNLGSLFISISIRSNNNNNKNKRPLTPKSMPPTGGDHSISIIMLIKLLISFDRVYIQAYLIRITTGHHHHHHRHQFIIRCSRINSTPPTVKKTKQKQRENITTVLTIDYKINYGIV